MKFIHLGDLHIGKSLCGFDLLEDQKYILNQITDIAKENGVDAVLLAGDIYDTQIPRERAVRVLDDFLSELSYLGIKVFMISGNHDSDERINFGSRLLEKEGLYVVGRFDGELYRRTVTDQYGEVDVYLMPYIKASYVRKFFPDERIETYEDAVRTLIKHAEVNLDRRSIIVAHQFVTSHGIRPEMSGSESAAVRNVGTVEEIGSDCFDIFNYAALGHIHSPQKIGRQEVRYCGSPLKYSLSEANHNKSIPLIDMNASGECDIELIPLKPCKDLRHIKGRLNDLIKPSNIVDNEDYIYATLTDEDIIQDAMGIIKQHYPNAVHLDYDNRYSVDMQYYNTDYSHDEKSFDEIISDFFRTMHGCDITDEELAIMHDAAREAGIEHEAD